MLKNFNILLIFDLHSGAKCLHILLICLLFLLGVIPLQSQQVNVQSFNVGDSGIPQSQVYALLEDDRGYIWMGTRGGGVAYYDGVKFRRYSIKDGLGSNTINTLFEDHDHNIWIGTDKGVSVYNGIEFRNVFPKRETFLAVTAIAEDPGGFFWLGTNEGVFRYSNDSLIDFSDNSGFYQGPVRTIFLDEGKNVWIGTDRGVTNVSRIGEGDWEDKELLRGKIVEDIQQDQEGHIWFATYGGGLFIMKEGRLSSFPAPIDPVILALWLDSKGMMWIGTQYQGVSVWNPVDSSLNIINEEKGLPNDHVRAIIEDQWGNYWIGTSGGGTCRYFGLKFDHLDRKDGLPGKSVYSVAEDTAGVTWMGIADRGLTRLDSNGVTIIGKDSGFYDVKVKASMLDSRGYLWFGTEGRGVGIWNGEAFKFLTTQNGLSGNWIRDFLESDSGTIYIATAGGGITKAQTTDSAGLGFTFSYLTTEQGLLQNRVSCMRKDRLNRIWAGTTNKGLCLIDGDRVIATYTTADGLADNRIRSLETDYLGNLWIGTARGINKISFAADSLQFDTYGFETGLPSLNIYLLLMDNSNQPYLWIGTEQGLDRATLNEEGNIIEVKHFGKEEGFLGVETCTNSRLKDKEGNLWFGTVNGVSRVNPNTEFDTPTPPRISLTQINLFYQSLLETDFKEYVGPWNELKSGLSLPWNKNHLGFEFAGVNLSNPYNIRYRWKLEGWEDKWAPLSARNQTNYSNLPPGTYQFRVQACNGEENCTELEREIRFVIRSPLWQKWWFIAGITVFIIGVILLLIRFRIDLIKRREAEEKLRISMEKNLIQLEQKALQLQMNPHFIFNALNSIQHLIQLKEDQKARQYLAKFSRLLRLILENSRSTHVSLDDEVSLLEDYLSIERFSRGDKFEYSIKIDSSIPLEEVGIPPMMIQPFVENAIVHGVSPMEEKGAIGITFQQQEEVLECLIEDNGIGRKRAAVLKSQRENLHKSTALLVTQERMDMLNYGSEVQKSIEIIDKEDERGNASGTQVILNLPFIYI